MMPHVLHLLVGIRGGGLYKLSYFSIQFLTFAKFLSTLSVIGVLKEKIKFYLFLVEEPSFG
jgi:hypothetical protein